METIQVKWLVAHEPEHLFIRTAQAFIAALEEDNITNVEVEIITKQIFQDKYGKELVNVMGMIENNEIQMTQTQVHVYGNKYLKDFNVLDMPFLFNDHDHATRVLDGEIGKKMCADLATVSKLTGLAFTYSGGWRIIGSDRPITSLADLSKCKIRVNMNPINSFALSAIGAIPLQTIGTVEGYGYDKVHNGTLDAVESTYLRFLGKSIFKTNHSMFLTNISINSDFLNSLTPEMQLSFRKAAAKAAIIEREESIADAEAFEVDCISKGITIYDISQEDSITFKQSIKSVYDKYEKYFGKDLYDKIKNA